MRCNRCNGKITFDGEIGAGKTTLIKSILNHLNVKDLVTSPTFSIVNEYLTYDKNVIYHLDFFRIKSESEALELGFNEYIDSNNYCLIEWSNRIKGLLPSNLLKVKIEVLDYNKRKITVIKNCY